MFTEHPTTLISELIFQIRSHRKRQSPFSNDLSAIRRELRQRRKHFLGSYISLEAIVDSNLSTKEEIITELSHYLASRTLFFWTQDGATEDFCFRFYEIALYALSSGKVGDESVDDIIQLAECLVRSRRVFIDVVKKLLPADMIANLFFFTESYKDEFYTVLFEDAVLGAISVFLGIIEDPAAAPENYIAQEDC